jgi:hypothetical protein
MPVSESIVPPLSAHAETNIKTAKIYMVLCPSYHGATLLSLLLANHSRVFALCDTIPPKSFLFHRCGCGETFANCAFWQSVRATVGDVDALEFVPSRPRVSTWARLNAAIVIGSGLATTDWGMSVQYKKFVQANERFLGVCSTFKDFDVFIDGYKSLSRYVALKSTRFQIAGVIHLTRDPQQFVASAKRNKMLVKRSARQWSQLHWAISSVTRWNRERVYRVRYEDLCADPDRELSRLQAWIGLQEEDLKSPTDKDVHWIGNSSMINFDGQIRLPDSEIDLTPDERQLVQRITSSQAREFGYI